MREFEELLQQRRREIEKHLGLITELEGAVRSRASLGPVDTEHINILKSAFLVHLYNVIESVMSKVTDEVADLTRQHQPDLWVDSLFMAWIKHRASLEMEMAPTDRLNRIADVIAEAAGRKPVASTRVARREGNWTNKEIENIASSLACPLVIPDDIHHRACVRHFVNEMAPLTYVRHMRNQLGHGNLSFVDSGSALSLDQLQLLQAAVIDYMNSVVTSFVDYLGQKRFLRSTAA